MTISPSLPALKACTGMALQRTWAYRSRMALWILRNMLMLFSMRMIWTAVYGDRTVMNGIHLDMMILYVTIGMLQAYLLEPIASGEIARRIQRGTIASDLVRPVGFLPQMLAYDIGFLIGRIPLIAIVLPFAAIVGSLQAPPTLETAVGYAVSLILAYVLSVLVWLPIGMIGFWTINTTGINFLAYSVLAFVSGQMVPLWFLPDALRTTLRWLPFQGMSYAPLSIYVGETTGYDILITIATQAIWIVLLAALVWWIWQRARYAVQIQGG
ncbi:MAG: ABC-2 family transporter protein [Thermomicrobiales bacterium]|nr:ABC-2 family transporter protein [Thermomicrobiales bacterium]